MHELCAPARSAFIGQRPYVESGALIGVEPAREPDKTAKATPSIGVVSALLAKLREQSQDRSTRVAVVVKGFSFTKSTRYVIN